MIILKYWPIITSVLAFTTAFGMGYQKIETIEEAVKQQTEQQQVVVDVQKQQAASDAKLELMLQLIRDINRKIDK